MASASIIGTPSFSNTNSTLTGVQSNGTIYQAPANSRTFITWDRVTINLTIPLYTFAIRSLNPQTLTYENVVLYTLNTSGNLTCPFPTILTDTYVGATSAVTMGFGTASNQITANANRVNIGMNAFIMLPGDLFVVNGGTGATVANFAWSTYTITAS